MFGRQSIAREALDMAREARSLAQVADQRREAHEKLCTERWEQLRDSIRGMMAAVEQKHAENKISLGKLYWMIMVGMGVTICGMASLIVELALHGH